MATAPTFIQEAETAWNSTTSPKTTASFSVLAGDVLCAFAIAEASGNGGGSDLSFSISGGSLTWTSRQSIVVANNCAVNIWTATVDSDKSMTVTFTRTNGTNLWFGGNCLTFRGSDGVGASSKTNTTGAPTLNITTTQANSAVVVAIGDYAATAGTRTYRTGAGAFTAQSAFLDASHYWAGGGYHADSGATSTYAVGQTAPTGQTYSIVAVEIKGAAASGAITGSISLTLTPTGALTGSGALAGVVALSLTPTGALTGSGALASAIALSITPAGTLSGIGAMAGALSMSLGVTGALTGSGSLTGAIPLDLTPSGSLAGTGALASAIALSITPSGVLSGTGALTGAVALALDLTGLLTPAAPGDLNGTIPLALLTSGVLTGTGNPLGSISFSFDLTGALGGTALFTGLAAFALDVTGDLTDAGAIPVPPVVTETVTGGGFLYAYELHRAARRKRKREQEEREEEARKIKDEIDREISLLLQQKETEAERKAELDRLQALVKQHSNDQLQLSNRAKIAYVRALTQANFSAMEALDRELERQIHEEEITALMILLNED